MMSSRAEKVCFVISPIGDEGSEIRQRADDLYELVIEPALQKFRFKVIRADKIPRPSVITADIIQLVQTADLCIIDLTEQNPNVFYECGRRHETGRPFIQLLRKGERLPFDVSGIRTISYDISSPRAVLASVQDIQQFVTELESTGYETVASGESLASIASSLDRIERKINQMATTSSPLATPASIEYKDSNPFQNPREALAIALTDNDIAAAAKVLPRVIQLMGLSNETVIFAAVRLALAGVPYGFDVLRQALAEHRASLAEDDLRTAIGTVVYYYTLVDREKDGLEFIEPIINEIIGTKRLAPEHEAWYLNQLQKLYYGSGAYEKAMRLAERVVELVPDDISYLYNLSGVYTALNLNQQAESTVDRYMRLPNREPDEDHLTNAIRVYSLVGRPDDAKAAFIRLESIDPKKAAFLLRADDDVRAVVGSRA